MDFPEELYYTKDHEWVRVDKSVAYIGVTEYALEQLGDVVYIELPSEGDSFDAGDSFGNIESTKTVSDLYVPLDCQIIAINEEIKDSLESLSDSAYDDGWLIKVGFDQLPEELMNAKQYKEFIESES